MLPQEFEWIKTLVQDVRAIAGAEFSGLGLIAYRRPLGLATLRLAPRYSLPKSIPGDPGQTAKFLAELSLKSSPAHDGFHLLDVDARQITHPCSYIAPSIPSRAARLLPDRPIGARFATALLASLDTSVICAIAASSHRRDNIFVNGVQHAEWQHGA